jgi:hypothetical protein
MIIALSYSVYAEHPYLFRWSPEEVVRKKYGANPFVESLTIARFIKERTSEKDRIAVIGSEPQIYFYADRHSATGYIYTYALMENQRFARQMQEEMIREVEQARPEFLVFVNVYESWLDRPESERQVFDWFEQYQQYFDRVGLVELHGQQPAKYYWGEDARRYVPPEDGDWASILQRKKPP